MSTPTDATSFSVSADELITVLQQKIGQYEVEKEAANLLLKKQAQHINELENKVLVLQSPPAPTAAE